MSKNAFGAIAILSMLCITNAGAATVQPEFIFAFPSTVKNGYFYSASQRMAEGGDGRIFFSAEPNVDTGCTSVWALLPYTRVARPVRISKDTIGCKTQGFVSGNSGDVWTVSTSGASGNYGALIRIKSGARPKAVYSYTEYDGTPQGYPAIFPDGRVDVVVSASVSRQVKQIVEHKAPKYLPSTVYTDRVDDPITLTPTIRVLNGNLYGIARMSIPNYFAPMFFRMDGTQRTVLTNLREFGSFGDIVVNGDKFYATLSKEGLGDWNPLLRLVTLDSAGVATQISEISGWDMLWHSAPLLASDGWMYSVGSGSVTYGNGAIFRMRPDGSDMQYLYFFDCQERFGCYPNTLVESRDGYMYGRTSRSASNYQGGIFRFALPKD